MVHLEPNPNALTSPGSALSERQRWETTISSIIDREMVAYLNRVTGEVVASKAVSPITVETFYVSAVDDIMQQLEAAPETLDILESALLESSLPYEVFNTANYLLNEALSLEVSDAELNEIMTAGLDYDEPSFQEDSQMVNSLEASAAPRIIGQALARAVGRGKRWRNQARDTARTASTNALNEALIRALQQLPQTHKQWITRRDDKVRETHADADGQIVPKASLFQVGSAVLLYPGQGTFPPEEVINCRCVIIGVYADGSTR